MIEIFTDGGARGNPGPAAIGIIIKSDKKVIYKKGEFIGEATNNFAEYTAVAKALKWLIDNVNSQFSLVSCYLDSQLVVQQLSGNWKIKNPILKKLFLEIKNLEQKIKAPVYYQQISRNKNIRADALVNLALDKALH
jgi:ribonuclease HI